MAKKQAENGMSDDFNKNMEQLQRNWFEACYLSGIMPLSDDECYQVLAWTYLYGGEECVFNLKFNGAIKAAQKRHNILGGEIPSIEAVEGIKKYINSFPVIPNTKVPIPDLAHPPEWVYEIEKKFEIKLYGEHK
jgi:hypothetical protein